ncbi:hypothetical protein [Streptomyces eurythermus]|uniref:hypothetical protein n=1 Tax=Streptomyces eurythermus TaxID=42237 RepID=UPI00340EE62F
MPAARPATTTVRVHPDGDLGPHRHGAQGRSCTTANDYLGHLTKRCPDPRQLSCPLPLLLRVPGRCSAKEAAEAVC